MKLKSCRHNLQLGQHPTAQQYDGADGTTVKRLKKQQKQKIAETENIRKSMTDEAVETVEHYGLATQR